MTLKQIIENDLHEAMRRNDELWRTTLRMLLASLKMIEIDKRSPLEELEIVSSIQKEIKMRNETLAELQSTDRQELINKAMQEIEILNHYLPAQLSDDELFGLVKETVSESGAVGIKEMGIVMKAILPKVNGRASAERISIAVRRTLS